MAQKDFTVEFEFVSTKADGDNYIRTRAIRASDEQSALIIARMIGGREFGARFTDNCVDWRIVRQPQSNLKDKAR